MRYAADIVSFGISSLCDNRFERAYGGVTTGKMLEYLLVNKTIICTTKYRYERGHCMHKSKEGRMQMSHLEKLCCHVFKRKMPLIVGTAG